MNFPITDIKNSALTLIISFTSGYFFSLSPVPAPYLLGSLFGVWVFGGGIKKLSSQMDIARWISAPVLLGLGTVVGSNFGPKTIINLTSTFPTVFAMLCATIVATSAGLTYLIYSRKYDFYTAFFSCIPGGQAEAVLLSREIVEKDYVVALFHLVRVALVFIATPIVLALIQGPKAVEASNIMLQKMPSLFEVEISVFFVFVVTSIIGFYLAKLTRIPMPHFIGPVLSSSTLHIFGFIELPRIAEFIILAQLVVGGSVGARLSKVSLHELSGYLIDALCNSMIVMSIYGISALLINSLTDLNLLKLLLAFVPGGLYEVTLLALIFGFDVAFVAFHHTIRVIVICIGMPAIVTYVAKREFEN